MAQINLSQAFLEVLEKDPPSARVSQLFLEVLTDGPIKTGAAALSGSASVSAITTNVLGSAALSGAASVVAALSKEWGSVALVAEATLAALEADYIAHDTFDELSEIPLSSHTSNSGDSWGASSGNLTLVVTTSGYATWQ